MTIGAAATHVDAGFTFGDGPANASVTLLEWKDDLPGVIRGFGMRELTMSVSPP